MKLICLGVAQYCYLQPLLTINTYHPLQLKVENEKKTQQCGPYLEGCWMKKEPYEANMLGYSIRLLSIVHKDETVVDYQ